MRGQATVDNWQPLLRTLFVELDSRHGPRPLSGEPGVDRSGRPACSKHGSMLRVHSTLRMYRCLADEQTCNAAAVHLDDADPERRPMKLTVQCVACKHTETIEAKGGGMPMCSKCFSPTAVLGAKT